MPLPRAVREQAERAEALHQALVNGNTANAAPGATQATQTQTADNTVSEVPAPANVPAPAPTPAVEPQPAPTDDSLELRYRVLQGKYNAEVPRLHAEIRELKATVQALQSQPPAPADDGVSSVRERYGDEFAEAVQAVAASQVQQLRTEFSGQVAVAKETAQQLNRRTFLSDLGTLVPNFAAVDREPGFTAFLDEFDAMTGRPRREFFNEADEANDAARVASFFRAYLGAKQRAAAPTPAPTPAPAVDHLLTPDAGIQSDGPPAARIWTREEISRFYADARPNGNRRRGVYSEAEFARIEQDINAALLDGRVR